MRKVEKIEGTAFTQRKTVREVTETPDEMKDAFRQMAERGKDPWANHRQWAEAAREALTRERKDKPAGYQFKTREEAGWYLDRMITLERAVRHHIEAGDAAWAAHEAVLFGETFNEFQLKLAREELFLLGKRTLEQRTAGGSATRKGSDAKRVEKVRLYLARGDKLTEAYRNAARDLDCGVSTVRGAWDRMKKGADASD
jgi:hypothetical protein